MSMKECRDGAVTRVTHDGCQQVASGRLAQATFAPATAPQWRLTWLQSVAKRTKDQKCVRANIHNAECCWNIISCGARLERESGVAKIRSMRGANALTSGLPWPHGRREHDVGSTSRYPL